jgi:hypothetical protein
MVLMQNWAKSRTRFGRIRSVKLEAAVLSSSPGGWRFQLMQYLCLVQAVAGDIASVTLCQGGFVKIRLPASRKTTNKMTIAKSAKHSDVASNYLGFATDYPMRWEYLGSTAMNKAVRQVCVQICW